MILVINTTQPENTFIALARDGFIINKKELKSKHHQSEKLLPEISKLIPTTKLKNLKAIIVVTGPGAFTSIRIGITIANTLAYALKIPVIGVKATEFKNSEELIKIGETRLKSVRGVKPVQPFYGKKPNIIIRSKK